MSRFKLHIEYEGTRYSGWQVQKNARTVQGELLHACGVVFGKTVTDLQGSGRTDAGVHALHQVAHLDVRTMLAPEIIRMKLNDELPADISLLEVEKAPANFHARHSALSRTYLYQISRRRTAFGKRFVWWVKDPLDVRVMAQAAELFCGMKDFRSFTDDDPEEKSTLVHMEHVSVTEAGSLLLVRVTGSHFLWKLVRRIVGMLVEAGRGSTSLSEVASYIAHPSDDPARFTAPPAGLFLERVTYQGDPPLTPPVPLLTIPAWQRPAGHKNIPHH